MLEVLANGTSQEKKLKGTSIKKEQIKPSLFADDMVDNAKLQKNQQQRTPGTNK